MKRIIGLALCLCMMCMAMSALAGVPEKPQTYAYAYDFDGTVLSEADKQQITAYGSALEEQTGMQVIAVVVEFLDGMTPEDYATDLINTWGIGQAGEDNGAVILLARGDRKIQIGTGKGIDRILTGAKCGELIDARLGCLCRQPVCRRHGGPLCGCVQLSGRSPGQDAGCGRRGILARFQQLYVRHLC